MALPATDSFTRANSTDIGTNWTPENGSFELVSNAVLPNGPSAGTENAERWNADTFGNDHYAQCVVVSNGVAGSGPAVRCNSGDWYGFYGYASDSWLFKYVSGSWTQLATDPTGFTASDVLYLEVSGTDLDAQVNSSSIMTASDSAIASGSAGITGWGDNSGTVIDDFEADDLGGGGGGFQAAWARGANTMIGAQQV